MHTPIAARRNRVDAARRFANRRASLLS
jgi:hypothetical protein